MSIKLIAKLSNLVGATKKLLFNTKTQMGDLVIDATHSVNINYSNSITTHPIESGAFVSDHIYINPLEVSMDCSITDSSSNIISAVRDIAGLLNGNILNNLANKFKGKGVKQIDAYQYLKDLVGSKSTITIVDKLDVFRDMAVLSISVPRTSETGDRLYFSITLRQIKYATVAYATGLNRSYNINGRTSLGKQNSKEATPEQVVRTKTASANLSGLGR
jgi:hypothetical protein